VLEHTRIEGPSEAHAELLSRVRDAGWIRSLIAVAACGSTNDLAREAAQDGPEPVLVVAETQTAGRGRRGARWSDARGAAVLMSLGWRPEDCGVETGPLFAIAGACAAADVARGLGVPACVKWPNDIWVDERKVGGVLAETVVARSRVALAVVGIGLNVTSSPPPEALGPDAVRPTSLAESGWTTEESPSAISGAVAARYAAFLDPSHRPMASMVVAFAEDRSAIAGRTVQVCVQGETLRGHVLGLSPTGGLLLEAEGVGRVELTDASATVRLV
jgi:BirA family biotin operon repressor/biotin-[acetyl-CoA-carboxylase] ligase